MSEERFWRITPRAFFAALEHARQLEWDRERAAFLRAGIAAAAIYNTAGWHTPDGGRIEPHHLFPNAGLEPLPRVQTEDEMLRAVMQWHAVLTAQTTQETM